MSFVVQFEFVTGDEELVDFKQFTDKGAAMRRFLQGCSTARDGRYVHSQKFGDVMITRSKMYETIGSDPYADIEDVKAGKGTLIEDSEEFWRIEL